MLGFALSNHSRSLPGPVSTVTVKVPRPPKRPLVTNFSVPRSLSIPSLGIHAKLVKLGLNGDGTVQVPKNTSQPGWYHFGPSPGQSGSAVILGHVDSFHGPGIFFKLRTLVPGRHIEVSLADGKRAIFIVTAVQTFLKSSFPTERVYGSHGYAELQLVTCGGVFNPRTGSYESNIIVFSVLNRVFSGV